jgi:concanavalin A-like lectin/glucanase superfamily protein
MGFANTGRRALLQHFELRKRHRLLPGLTMAACLVSLLCPIWAAADTGEAFEAQEYQNDFSVSIATAEEYLETQERGVGLPETLTKSLGDKYAGVWFNNMSGEFVVPVVPGASADVGEVLDTYNLEPKSHVQAVTSTWLDLESAQKEISQAVSDLSQRGLVETLLDPKRNSVVIREANGASIDEEARLAALVAHQNVDVEITRVDTDRFDVTTRACVTFKPRACDKPLRGGVAIAPLFPDGGGGYTYSAGACTAGFKAIGNVFGNRFMLTAGHCPYFYPGYKWASNTPANNVYEIGPAQEYNFSSTGDWAKLNANGSAWDTGSWPSEITHYWSNQEYPIQYEAPSYYGEYVCFSGNKSGTSCGNVTGVHVEGLEDGITHKILPPENEVPGICTEGGDSGGPVYSFSSNTALGMLSAGEGTSCATDVGYYVDITEATENLGVTVGARVGAPPVVRTDPPTQIQAKGAEFNGLVNPNGLDTTYEFEYGTTTVYGHYTEPLGSAGSGSRPVSVSRSAQWLLKPNTTYHYRLTAWNSASNNANISVTGADQQFTTPAIPPVVNTDTAREILATQAKLGGTVNPEETPSHVVYEYGPTTSYGTTVATGDVGDDREAHYFNQVVTGLQPSTTYHFRITATNAAGQTTYGNDQTFTTPSLAPIVITEAPTNSGETAAALHGSVNPQGSASQYQFEYGLSSAYGTTIPVPSGNVGSGYTSVEESQAISGLTPGVTYHYRIVATNSFGTTQGADQLLTAGWNVRPVPSPEGAKQAELSGMSCLSPTSCMAVGNYRNASEVTLALAEHWDGTKWEVVPVPTPEGNIAVSELFSVSCPAANLCMATGFYFTNTGQGGAITERWNGTKWEIELSPVPEQSTSYLYGVSCVSATWCEAVGYATTNGLPAPMAEHWDGSKWEIQPTPTLEGMKATVLTTVSCPTATSCEAMGIYENSAGQFPVAEHWDGSKWGLQTVPIPTGTNKAVRLMSVSCGTATSCEAVGTYQSTSNIRTAFAERWTEGKWEVQSTPYPTGSAESFLLGVSCEAVKSCMATGVYVTGSGQTIPLASRWNGTKWEAQSPPYNAGDVFSDLESVSCVSKVCISGGYTRTVSGGLSHPVVAEFHTPWSTPLAVTDAASGIRATEATLNATVNPEGTPANYQFEYGKTTSYGTKVPVLPKSIGAGTTNVVVSEPISGLEAGTTYHYRVVASNLEGITAGEDKTFTPPTYATAIASDNPISYWRLGETSGTNAADERAANPGTYQNSPTLGTTSLLATDTANKAVSFDGTNDSVQVSNSTSLQPTSSISLEAWIKPTSLPTAGSFTTILNKTEAFALQFNGPKLELRINQGEAKQRLQAPEGTIVAGQAYYVVGTYDGTTQRLYVNGALVASAALTGSFNTNTNALYIGSSDGSGNLFKGTIDEPAVYSAALSAAKIEGHYEAGSGPPPPPPPTYATAIASDNPISYWRLGETSGTNAADERAANPGTYQNSPTLGTTSLLATDTANKAVSFDGTNDSVQVSNSTSLQPTSSISLEAWIKPTSLPTAGSFTTILNKTEAFALQFNGPKLELRINQGEAKQRLQAPEGTIVAGQAYYVVGTYDGTTQRLYVNGALVASAALTGSFNTNTNALYIGSSDGSGNLFKGTIDEPAVYSAALSAAKIEGHYEAGSGS